MKLSLAIHKTQPQPAQPINAALESYPFMMASLLNGAWHNIQRNTAHRNKAIDQLHGALLLAADLETFEVYREILFLIEIAWIHIGATE